MATLGWSDQDHAVALGVVPVGATKITYGGNAGGSTDFFDAAVEELGGEAPARYDDTDGIPFAEVAKVEPRPDPGHQQRPHQGRLRQAHQDRARSSPTRGAVGHPVAHVAGDRRQGAGPVRRGRPKVEDETEARSTRRQGGARRPRGQDASCCAYLSTTDLSTVGIYGAEDTRVAFLRDFGLEDAPAVLRRSSSRASSTAPSRPRSPTDLASDVVLAFTDEGGTVEDLRRRTR